MPAYVSLEDISRILNLICSQPNKRTIPTESDLKGDYDLWFDGGAVRSDTGTTRYDFPDGSSALMHVLPYTNVRIDFSNGESKYISQKKV